MVAAPPSASIVKSCELPVPSVVAAHSVPLASNAIPETEWPTFAPALPDWIGPMATL